MNEIKEPEYKSKIKTLYPIVVKGTIRYIENLHQKHQLDKKEKIQHG